MLKFVSCLQKKKKETNKQTVRRKVPTSTGLLQRRQLLIKENGGLHLFIRRFKSSEMV